MTSHHYHNNKSLPPQQAANPGARSLNNSAGPRAAPHQNGAGRQNVAAAASGSAALVSTENRTSKLPPQQQQQQQQQAAYHGWPSSKSYGYGHGYGPHYYQPSPVPYGSYLKTPMPPTKMHHDKPAAMPIAQPPLQSQVSSAPPAMLPPPPKMNCDDDKPAEMPMVEQQDSSAPPAMLPPPPKMHRDDDKPAKMPTVARLRTRGGGDDEGPLESIGKAAEAPVASRVTFAASTKPAPTPMTPVATRRVSQQGAPMTPVASSVAFAESTKPAPTPKTPVADAVVVYEDETHEQPPHQKVDVEDLFARTLVLVSQTNGAVAKTDSTMRDGFTQCNAAIVKTNATMQDGFAQCNAAIVKTNARVDANERGLQETNARLGKQEEEVRQLREEVFSITKNTRRVSSTGTRVAPRSAKKTLEYDTDEEQDANYDCKLLSDKGNADKKAFIEKHNLEDLCRDPGRLKRMRYKPSITKQGTACQKCLNAPWKETPGMCWTHQNQLGVQNWQPFEHKPLPGYATP